MKLLGYFCTKNNNILQFEITLNNEVIGYVLH